MNRYVGVVCALMLLSLFGGTLLGEVHKPVSEADLLRWIHTDQTRRMAPTIRENGLDVLPSRALYERLRGALGKEQDFVTLVVGSAGLCIDDGNNAISSLLLDVEQRVRGLRLFRAVERGRGAESCRWRLYSTVAPTSNEKDMLSLQLTHRSEAGKERVLDDLRMVRSRGENDDHMVIARTIRSWLRDVFSIHQTVRSDKLLQLPEAQVLLLSLDEVGRADEQTLSLANTEASAVRGVTGRVESTDPQLFTAGVSGGALLFDGKDDVVKMTLRPTLDFAGPFTISMWFRRHGMPNGKSPHDDTPAETLLAKGRTSLSGSWNLRFDTEDGACVEPREGLRLAFSISDLAGRTLTQYSYHTRESENMGDEWHHLAAIYDGDDGRMQVYLDGELLRGSQCGTPFFKKRTSEEKERDRVARFRIKSSVSMMAGAMVSDSGAPNEHFKGAIDEILIYTRALNSAEVQRIFDYGLDTYRKRRQCWFEPNCGVAMQ
jgi:hypothetical protein